MATTSMAQPRRLTRVAQAEKHCPAAGINVGSQERLISLLSGGALAVYGLTRGTTSGLLLASLGGALAYRGATGHCSVYQALGYSTANGSARTTVPARRAVRVEESITVLRPREELFAFWRRLENLPRIMPHLISVKELNENRSHWMAHGLTGPVEWEAEIFNERPGELIAWKSLPGAEVATAGCVQFETAPGHRGTEVKVEMEYIPPAGRLGAGIAWLAGRDAESQIREDLRTFKRIMETGTVPTTEGQPQGRCAF